MRIPARLVPQSLTGRVFALYAATLIAFLGVAVGLFSYQQFTSELDDALESARILSEVATPTITDSVVIGDYDTVRRTLGKTIQRSPFSSASFIDRSGSVIRVDRAASSAAHAPAWLSDTVAERLTDINTVIAVGGRDYGVLRLRFAPSLIADRIWLVTGYALALAAVTLLAGLLIIRFSLRRWLGPLEGIRQFAWQGSAGRGDEAAPSSVPIEIRETLDAFSRAGAELQVQRVTAAATLNAVADGVITTDSDGRILYANPAAERMFRRAGALPGRNIVDVVPAAFGGRDARGGIAAWSGRRVELAAESGGTLALDTTLSPIRGAGGEAIGHVLACRDITEAQAYEARLRSELETRQAAISSLGGALREMLPDARPHELAGSDTDLGNVSRLVARLVQEQRVAHDQLREKEREARKLALIAARTDNAVVLTDETGRVVWVNEGFARLTGYTAEEIVGRKPGELLQGPRTNRETVRRIGERLRRGEGFKEELLNYRKDGREYWVAVEVQPIFSERGKLTNYMAIESDITARRAEQRRLSMQFEVASALATADDVGTAVRRIMKVIGESLGWQVGQFWKVDEGRLRVLGAWHEASDSGAEFVAASLAGSLERGMGLPGRVWDAGAPVWLTFKETTGDRLLFEGTWYPQLAEAGRHGGAVAAAPLPGGDASGDGAGMVTRQIAVDARDVTDAGRRAFAAVGGGLRCGLAFPVLVHGEAWGVAEFFSTQSLEPDEALLKTFATIGVQVGQFVVRREAQEAARREQRLLEEARRREVRLGHEIQRSLLIGDIPVGVRGAEIAGYAAPSRGIDGDFYALTMFRPDCFELLVGDVMGKGVPAALVGAALRTTYNQVVTELAAAAGGGADGLPGPAAIVNALHGRLTPRLIELETFVTLALYRFDLARGIVTFVNAGHTPALLLRGGGRVERILGENVPVGVLEDERYVEASLPMAADDLLLVYSDGITEARNYVDAEFGEHRLQGFLRGLGAARVPVNVGLQALRKRVHDYIGERVMADDETAVMVGRRRPFVDLGAVAGPGEEMLELPWSLAGLEPLRQRVAAAATALGPEVADRLVLAAFEAATNVVRHVRRPFDDATLSCRLRRETDRVTVELWYIGPLFGPEQGNQPDFSGVREGGFGMYIIDKAVSQVVYEQPALDVCCTRLVQIADAAAIIDASSPAVRDRAKQTSDISDPSERPPCA